MTQLDLQQRLERTEARLAACKKIKMIWKERAWTAEEERDALQQQVKALENDEIRQRLANAEHQLYMKDLAIQNVKASRQAQWHKRKAAEAELQRIREAVPTKIPRVIWKVIYDECGAFADCEADPQKIWDAFRKVAVGEIAE